MDDYIKPVEVTSPKSYWRLLEVLHDGGPGGWAAAEGQWESNGRWENRLALRWNGTSDTKNGNPQSRGRPTWFLIPPELEDSLRKAVSAEARKEQEQSC